MTLQEQALDIINRLSLLELLNNFGEAHIVGNVAFDTTVRPDIDIQIYANSSKIQSEQQDIIKQLEAIGITNIITRKLHKSAKFLILGKFEERGVSWNVDLAFTSPSTEYLYDSYRFFTDSEGKLTEHKRELIKKFKTYYFGTKLFEDNPSYYIYRGVLENDITEINEMTAYLNSIRQKMHEEKL